MPQPQVVEDFDRAVSFSSKPAIYQPFKEATGRCNILLLYFQEWGGVD